MSDLPLVLSVTSGKGGVGKTNVSVNLACCLAGAGKRVVLLDADLGLANVDVLLGLTPPPQPVPPVSRRREPCGHSVRDSLWLQHSARLLGHERNADTVHRPEAGIA